MRNDRAIEMVFDQPVNLKDGWTAAEVANSFTITGKQKQSIHSNILVDKTYIPDKIYADPVGFTDIQLESASLENLTEKDGIYTLAVAGEDESLPQINYQYKGTTFFTAGREIVQNNATYEDTLSSLQTELFGTMTPTTTTVTTGSDDSHYQIPLMSKLFNDKFLATLSISTEGLIGIYTQQPGTSYDSGGQSVKSRMYVPYNNRPAIAWLFTRNQDQYLVNLYKQTLTDNPNTLIYGRQRDYSGGGGYQKFIIACTPTKLEIHFFKETGETVNPNLTQLIYSPDTTTTAADTPEVLISGMYTTTTATHMKIEATPLETTGTFISEPFTFNSDSGATDVLFPNKVESPETSLIIEYSKDGKITWLPIADIVNETFTGKTFVVKVTFNGNGQASPSFSNPLRYLDSTEAGRSITITFSQIPYFRDVEGPLTVRYNPVNLLLQGPLDAVGFFETSFSPIGLQKVGNPDAIDTSIVNLNRGSVIRTLNTYITTYQPNPIDVSRVVFDRASVIRTYTGGVDT